MYKSINAASNALDNSSVFEMFNFDEIHYDCVVGYMWMNDITPHEAAVHFGVMWGRYGTCCSGEPMSKHHCPACHMPLEDRPSTCNVRLTEALQALLNMDVNGHTLQDRLQFSDKGRVLLEQARAALGVAL